MKAARPVIITQNGASTAVLRDHASYQRTQDTLAMLKLVAMGEAEIAKGQRALPHPLRSSGICASDWRAGSRGK